MGKFLLGALVAFAVAWWIFGSGSLSSNPLASQWLPKQIQTECSVGLTRTNATLTVSGLGAGAYCENITKGSTQYFLLSQPPTQPVLCEYTINNLRFIVRDQGALVLVGRQLCSDLAQQASTAPVSTISSGMVAPTGGSGNRTGKAVFDTYCNACHPGGDKGVGPAIKGANPSTVRTFVRYGKGAMPAFGVERMTDSELTDLTIYIQSLN